jgi:hypothetical protein
MIDFQKLKREWKTFAWAVASTILEVQIYLNPDVLVQWLGEQYSGLVHMLVPIGFLLLRKWKDSVETPNSDPGHGERGDDVPEQETGR